MLAPKLRALPTGLARHFHHVQYKGFRPAHPAVVSTIGRRSYSKTGHRVALNAEDISSKTATPREDEGIKTTDEKKVAILWDLDNKPPFAIPEDVAMSVRRFAMERGTIVEYSAMANFHAFKGLPPAARRLKEERLALMAAESRGEYIPAEPYRCPVCGRKCPTTKKLEKHYEELHARELSKRKNHLKVLKGKKREKWLKNRGDDLHKRNEAHRSITAPETEHAVFRSLKRAGVLVRKVKETPQAADQALSDRWARVTKDSNLTLILISDDSDFCNMVRRAKSRYGVHVIVVNNSPHGKLAKDADERVSWETFNPRVDSDNSRLRQGLMDLMEDDDDWGDIQPEHVLDYVLGDEDEGYWPI
ncbi:hypothetical protein F5Y11DRAFT_316453 [Daldinia sp. FL1419]|nr:hypothetical protein F5Y11DRAFT_316453 [Daldinia sp. FL1419]